MWLRTIIDAAFGAALFCNAMLFVPQIISLLRLKDSREVSFLTFFGFNILQVISILYGVVHQDYILVFGFTLSFVTCGLVTILILFYRH